MRIRKGDRVQVLHRQGPRQVRRGHARHPVEEQGDRRGRQHRQALQPASAARCRAASSTRTCRMHVASVAIVCWHCGPTRIGTGRTTGSQGPRLPEVRCATCECDQDCRGKRPRLRTRYDAEVRAAAPHRARALQHHGGARLKKIVINMGVGRATQQQSLLEGAVKDMTAIAGQKPVVTKAGSRLPASSSARATPSAAW